MGDPDGGCDPGCTCASTVWLGLMRAIVYDVVVASATPHPQKIRPDSNAAAAAANLCKKPHSFSTRCMLPIERRKYRASYR